MSRDYKHRADRRKKRTTLSPWAGVLAGLLIGLFVAFLVYIKLQSEPGPVYIQETLPPQATAPQEDVRDVRKDKTDVIPPPPKPRFDFYTLLPEMEVVIPEEEFTEHRKQTVPPPVVKTPVAEPAKKASPPPQTTPKPVPVTRPAPQPTGTYYLQVGSFRNGVQAERFRAELAMQGMQTSIQTVTINNTDTYHRVRVGPFGSLDEVDKTRHKLRKKGIESTPIKVRG